MIVSYHDLCLMRTKIGLSHRKSEFGSSIAYWCRIWNWEDRTIETYITNISTNFSILGPSEISGWKHED